MLTSLLIRKENLDQKLLIMFLLDILCIVLLIDSWLLNLYMIWNKFHVKQFDDTRCVILCLYVDDILILGSNMHFINDV